VEESVGWRDCEAQCLGPLFPQSLETCASSGVTENCREPDPGTEWDSVSPAKPQQEEEFNVLLLPEKEIEEVIKKDWRTEGTEEGDMEQETED
jgi:hypothetical protein